MDVWIYDAVRTPRGKARADGGLASLKPQELVGGLIDALEARGQDPRAATGLVLGAVGQVGAQGGNIALVSKLHAGLNDEAHAFTINNYCASGLTAIGHAAGQIALGSEGVVLAGGVEMMSRVPFMADAADYYADTAFPTRSRYIPVALAADRLAGEENISREALDAVALTSQVRALEAEQTPGLVASRIPLAGLSVEECLRPKMTAEMLAAMPPAFGGLAGQFAEALGEPIQPILTIAHAPPVCDGAALAIVGGPPGPGATARARIRGYAEMGGDPHAALLAGFTAMDRALAQAGLTIADMDRIEFMESFAVTIAKFLRDRPVDVARVNVGGGHLAKGHPMGATGAVLLSSLLDALDVADGRWGLVVASAAGGIGAAMVVERL